MLLLLKWMTKLIKLLERRWRFTKNLDADFLNQCTRRLLNSNLPLERNLRNLSNLRIVCSDFGLVGKTGVGRS